MKHLMISVTKAIFYGGLLCTSFAAYADHHKINPEKLMEIYGDEKIVSFLQNACETAPTNILTDPQHVTATMPALLRKFSIEDEMKSLEQAEISEKQKEKITEYLENSPRTKKFIPVQSPKATTRLKPGKVKVALYDKGNNIEICSYVMNVTADETPAYPHFNIAIESEGKQTIAVNVTMDAKKNPKDLNRGFKDVSALINGKKMPLNAAYYDLKEGRNDILLMATDLLGRRGVQHYYFNRDITTSVATHIMGPILMGAYVSSLGTIWEWAFGKTDQIYTVIGAEEGCDCKLTCVETISPDLCSSTFPLIQNPSVDTDGHYANCDATPSISGAKTWQHSPFWNINNETQSESVEVVENCTITCEKEENEAACLDCCPTPVIKYQISTKIGDLVSEVEYEPDQAASFVQTIAKGIINYEQGSAAVAGSQSFTYKKGYKITGSATSSVGVGVSAEASLKDAKIGRSQTTNVGITAGLEEYAEATYTGKGTSKITAPTPTLYVTGLQHAKECTASQQRSVSLQQNASAHGYSRLGKFGVIITGGLAYLPSNALSVTSMKDKAYVKRNHISATCNVAPPAAKTK